MSLNEGSTPRLPSDFTLLEGLYQLVVSGNTDEWEFERLNKAVYDGLLSTYGAGEPASETESIG
jgi:hypothetical protein